MYTGKDFDSQLEGYKYWAYNENRTHYFSLQVIKSLLLLPFDMLKSQYGTKYKTLQSWFQVI